MMAARNEASLAMHWPDTISSYKCFETIATPSPIPIAKRPLTPTNSAQPGRAAGLSDRHSTSPDSLADSEPTDRQGSRASRTSRGEGRASGDCGGDTCNSSGSCCDCLRSDSDQLTECDSIDNCYEASARMPSIAAEWIDPNRCDDDYERPIVTDFVRKASAVGADRLCENRACTFRQFSECHSVNVCACDRSDLSGRDPNDSKPVVISIREPKEYTAQGSGQSGAPPPLPLPPNLAQKLRRASSGSVGRMETIIESPIEDPIEPKISVKEILQRFETLTSLEVGPVGEGLS